MDSLDLNIIQTWILDPDNSTKNRKKRAHKRQVPITNAENVIRDIYNLAGGATCADKQCTQTLWLYKGPSEFDSRTDLHYFSQICLTSRPHTPQGDLHTSRINIIQLYLQDKYYLSHLDLHRNLTIGGTPLFKQIHEMRPQTNLHYDLPTLGSASSY